MTTINLLLQRHLRCRCELAVGVSIADAWVEVRVSSVSFIFWFLIFRQAVAVYSILGRPIMLPLRQLPIRPFLPVILWYGMAFIYSGTCRLKVWCVMGRSSSLPLVAFRGLEVEFLLPPFGSAERYFDACFCQECARPSLVQGVIPCTTALPTVFIHTGVGSVKWVLCLDLLWFFLCLRLCDAFASYAYGHISYQLAPPPGPLA